MTDITDNMYVFVNIIGHCHDRLSGGRQSRDRDLEVAVLFHEQDTSRIEVLFDETSHEFLLPQYNPVLPEWHRSGNADIW
jgi:hypothetical protein